MKEDSYLFWDEVLVKVKGNGETIDQFIPKELESVNELAMELENAILYSNTDSERNNRTTLP